MDGTLCGVWIDGEGRARVCMASADGGRVEKVLPFEPFAWLASNPFDTPVTGVTFEQLKGGAALGTLARASFPRGIRGFGQGGKGLGGGGCDPAAGEPVPSAAPGAALFRHGVRQARRCQVDIETGSSDGEFSSAEKPEDRVLAIGMRMGGKNQLLLLEDMSDQAERKLLLAFSEQLAALDPDVIEGHNIFKFDLDYLRDALPAAPGSLRLGALGQRATFAAAA